MTIANATPEELKQVDDYTVQLRALCGTFMKAQNQMTALINAWNTSISQIIGTPADLPVKDSSSLIGIAPLTDTDIYGITGYFEGCTGTYYDATHQQLMTKAAGPLNTI